MKSTILFGLSVLIALLSGLALAGDDQKHYGEKMHKKHQAMLTACEGKKDGDKVSITGRDGEAISAVCVTNPATLVAVPEQRLEQMQRMKAACNGKVAGDIVSFDSAKGDNMTGTCTSRGGELMAVPERMRHKKH